MFGLFLEGGIFMKFWPFRLFILLYICGFLSGGGERIKPMLSLKLLFIQQFLAQPGGHCITLLVVQQVLVQLEGQITTVRQQDILQPGWQ